MATTQRITPNTTTTTSSTVSNDKLKKGAMYGGAGVAIAAALAGAAYHIHNILNPIVKPEPAPEPAPEPITEKLTEDPDLPEVAPAVRPEPVHPKPEPTHVHPETNPNTGHPEPVHTPADPDPNTIAQEIIGQAEIDAADINIPPMIQFDNFSVYYDAMGNEYQAAIFHLNSGEQFKLVDLNHDGLFTEIFDLAGYQVGSIEDLNAPFYFTEEDIRFALENEIGYVGPAAEPGDSTMDLDLAASITASEHDVAMEVPANPAAIASEGVVDDIDINDVDVQAIISSILNNPVEPRAEVVINEDPTPEPIIVDPMEIEDDQEIADSDADADMDAFGDSEILS